MIQSQSRIIHLTNIHHLKCFINHGKIIHKLLQYRSKMHKIKIEKWLIHCYVPGQSNILRQNLSNTTY
jgi:hypothetical protein